MKFGHLVNALEELIFGNRRLILVLFGLVTLFMATSLTNLRIDAGFSKLLPLKHEYMQTFTEHSKEFGGANRVLIALMSRKGDMFTPEFFDTLEKATDDVFFIPGVDRTRVRCGDPATPAPGPRVTLWRDPRPTSFPVDW